MFYQSSTTSNPSLDDGKNEWYIDTFKVVILNEQEDNDEDEDELLFTIERHVENSEDDKDMRRQFLLEIMKLKQQELIEDNEDIETFINILNRLISPHPKKVGYYRYNLQKGNLLWLQVGNYTRTHIFVNLISLIDNIKFYVVQSKISVDNTKFSHFWSSSLGFEKVPTP